jgi:7-cyano-7-deazaguanine reductase
MRRIRRAAHVYQIHRRDGVCELFVNANRFLSVWAGITVSSKFTIRKATTAQGSRSATVTLLDADRIASAAQSGARHRVIEANRYNKRMPKSPRYTPEHAAAGLDTRFPEIETWPNQFPGYEIVVDDPEFTSVCPKTGLPDFGVVSIRYMPDKECLELKSLKEYLQCYRNLGIFQENVVNQVLKDVVKWAKPVWAEVKGEFRPRGGISTTIVAKWPRTKK